MKPKTVTSVTLTIQKDVESTSEEDYEKKLNTLIKKLEENGWCVNVDSEEPWE